MTRGWVQSIQNVDNLCAKTEGGLKETKLADKRKYYFPFSEFYGILRKTFNITRSRNAQGRFWIRQRDDLPRGVVFVYCVADFDRWENCNVVQNARRSWKWRTGSSASLRTTIGKRGIVAHNVRRYRGCCGVDLGATAEAI